MTDERMALIELIEKQADTADRGLRGVKLVMADDHKGLRAAARRVFNATQQRCRIHWMRNALAHAPIKQRAAVAAMLKTIFARGKPRPKPMRSGLSLPTPCAKSSSGSWP